MKIRLFTLNSDNQKGLFYYDNLTNQLYDCNMQKIDLTTDERVSALTNANDKPIKCQASPKPHKTSLYGKDSHIHTLKLQLGFKCNMKCQYCAQSEQRNVMTFNSSIKDVDSFIKSLQDNKITLDIVHLWGGEPLVYWKHIKRLVPQLKQLYPQLDVAMITNGTLLSKEKVDWMKKYNIHITLSHDGIGYHFRGPDPLHDPEQLKLWRYAIHEIENGSINCVLTPANTDLIANHDYFVSKLGNVYVGYEGVMTHLGSTDKLKFTDQQLFDLQRSVFKVLTSQPWSEYPGLRRIAISLLKKWSKPLDREIKTLYRCDMANTNTMACDLKGNVLSCHDFHQPENFVGQINDLKNVDLSKHFTSTLSYEQCRSCPVLSICNGTCPQMKGIARELTCKNDFAYHMAIFIAVFWLVFGERVVDFEPVYD